MKINQLKESELTEILQIVEEGEKKIKEMSDIY